MKQIYASLLFAAAIAAAPLAANAQGVQIIKTNGTTIEVPYAELDRIVPYEAEPTPPEPPIVTADPKIGDYFYSDGTWSDGGLISIDADGQNAVYADPRPMPLEGKSVIGIVFTTDQSRMAQADIDAGYTHGYVIACKNATDPGKSNYERYPESIWFANPYSGCEVEVNPIAKTAKSCYEAIDGRTETANILSYNTESPEIKVPLFYYCTTGFPVAAPENTSGWFVPSMGQMWDCVANLCSGSAAAWLATERTVESDFSYEKLETGENLMEIFMRAFENVPAADKDEITVADGTWPANTVALGTSTRYDSESAMHINLGMDEKGLIQGMCGWFDEEIHGRPILAF